MFFFEKPTLSFSKKRRKHEEFINGTSRKRPRHRGDQKQDSSCSFRIPYKGQGLPSSSVLNFALQLRDMAVRVADERRLEVFDNDRIRRNLRVRRRDCLPTVEQRRHLCLTRSCNNGSAGLVMSINGPNLWPQDFSS